MIFTNRKIELLWDVSRRCNLSCNHCAANSSNNLKTLSWQDIFLILNNLKSKRELSLINLQGGEPLYLPFIKKLISYFRDKNIKYSVNTNGLLVDTQMIDCICSYAPQSFIFSFESLNKQQFYDLKKSWLFPKLVENVEKVVSLKNRLGISVEGICVITSINIESIPEIIKYANALHFDILVLSKLCYSGRAKCNKYLFPTNLQLYRLFSQINDYFRNSKISTKIVIP